MSGVDSSETVADGKGEHSYRPRGSGSGCIGLLLGLLLLIALFRYFGWKTYDGYLSSDELQALFDHNIEPGHSTVADFFELMEAYPNYVLPPGRWPMVFPERGHQWVRLVSRRAAGRAFFLDYTTLIDVRFDLDGYYLTSRVGGIAVRPFP